MKKPLISIIIPVFNMEKYIKECLESITNQSYKNLEIIVIDDGSKDRSLDILKQSALKDKRIKLLSHKNRGVSYTRNKGLEIATGDCIMFVDADDIIVDNYIKEMLETMEHHNLDVVKSSYGNFTDNKDDFEKISYFKENYASIDADSIEEIFINTPQLNSSCMQLIRKETIGKLRFNQEIGYAEDFYFTYNIFKSAKRIGYLNNNGYLCRNNPNSASRTKNIDKQIKNSLDCITAYKTLFKPGNKKRVTTKIVRHIAYLVTSIDVKTNSYKIYKEKIDKLLKSKEWQTLDKNAIDISTFHFKLRVVTKLLINNKIFNLYVITKLYQLIK